MRCSIVTVIAAIVVGAAGVQLGAMVQPGAGFTPRYYLGSVPGLDSRQSNSICQAGSHSCGEIGQGNFCCTNDRYCYIEATNGTLSPSCCSVGNDNCDTICDIEQYLCLVTTTITVSATLTTSTQSACCPRSCQAYSAYQCASSLGGGCCSLGYNCLSGNACDSTIAPLTSGIVSEIPAGCTANQITCASSSGGGCCDNPLTCAYSGTAPVCASGTVDNGGIRTGTNGQPVTIVQTDTGLSTGAKAGIGIGIALVVCFLTAIITWLVLRKRRSARLAHLDNQARSEAEGTVTEIIEQAASSGRGPSSRPRGAGSDYFSSSARPRPYTENSNISDNEGLQPLGGGVPMSPVSPSDAVGPIEIGASEFSRGTSNVTSPGEVEMMEYMKVPETTEHRVELP